ncbi:uncharacterized protein N0V89_005462 [Didymosphaeria variabile]|uniref:DUF3669 domain-containing protein n=1 Tax=Didymosphaeria variabile TaxID=1932322 RepID=A0A9W8XNK0_9PLEO|nr:uncharacterized protein N0V89_005462 [Didymosphaeria variabile]KAJ4353732.1 hypothetical protein N0V89_005462 [Didymosphaeria variabile]
MNTNSHYRCIGKGFCGSIWASEDSQDVICTAIKREDGGPGLSVTNDYNMHLLVLQGILKYLPSTPLSIPQCHALVQPTDVWWQTRLHQFPVGYSACRALISERIPRIPRQISDKIVDLFCAGNEPLSKFVKNNPDDDACLIRPYLGRRRHQRETASTSRFQRFSLRNVPLHIDQMEALGLDANAYAATMAEALALMHWVARIDANDVEFVLAPPRGAESPPSPVFQSDYLGTHCLWILDFDCCRPLSMDEAGVEQACVAFYKNDPFYPRPGGGEADEELWKVFKHKFLMASREILGRNSKYEVLAEDLMKRIEEEGQLRKKRKSEIGR